MIGDDDMVITRGIQVPKEMKELSCAALVAGIVEAVMDGSGFVSRRLISLLFFARSGAEWVDVEVHSPRELRLILYRLHNIQDGQSYSLNWTKACWNEKLLYPLQRQSRSRRGIYWN